MDTKESYFKWREAERRKHRVMTQAEYFAWTRSGDAISSPVESNPFPGGITVTFGPGSSLLGYSLPHHVEP